MKEHLYMTHSLENLILTLNWSFNVSGNQLDYYEKVSIHQKPIILLLSQLKSLRFNPISMNCYLIKSVPLL